MIRVVIGNVTTFTVKMLLFLINDRSTSITNFGNSNNIMKNAPDSYGLACSFVYDVYLLK